MASKLTVRELCQIALFTAVIAAGAQIAIPLPGGVPFTLQVTTISLAGLVLGPRKGSMATIVYVLLGAAGVPVFAHFTGGIGIVLGPTGGFILSFPLLALVAGLGEQTGKLYWTYAGLATGTAVNLLVGMLYFSLVLGTSLAAAFAVTVAPFIPTSAIMIILLPLLGRGIKATLVAARVGL